MKRVVGVAVLLVPIMARVSFAQEPITRVALVNSNIPSGAILKGIGEHCQGLVLTLDASKAAFQLEAQINKESENRNERSWLTLFNNKGDAIYATDTRGTGNAVRDVCEFLKLGKR
jgi:hypothetical protein